MFLVPAYALVVAAPSGPLDGCPSPRLITDALNARLPDIVAPPSDVPPPGALRLVVTGGQPPTPLRVELVDQGGEARLLRVLQPSDRGRPGDCAALAETVALIVDRYLHEVGYELPPSPAPPPPPTAPGPPGPPSPALPAEVATRSASPRAPPPAGARLDVLGGVAWRGASTGGGPEAVAGVGVDWGAGPLRLGTALSGGVGSGQSTRAPDATATLRRFPVHLAFYLAFGAGPGQLEPGVGVAVDWLFATVDWTRGPPSRHVRASPGVDLSLGYRMFLGDRFFLRPNASAAVSLPYRFVASSQGGGRVGEEELFSSPRTWFRAGLEAGVTFR